MTTGMKSIPEIISHQWHFRSLERLIAVDPTLFESNVHATSSPETSPRSELTGVPRS